MNSNAMRGAVLVGIAVLIGALILGWGADDSGDTVGEAAPVATAIPTVPALEAAPVATAVPQSTLPDALPRDPSQVRVQVANAARIPGLAGSISDRLGAQGYVTAGPTNATETSVSTVYYELGYEADANKILVLFNSPTTQIAVMPNPRPTVENPDTVDGGANIIMIVGSDDLSRS